MNRADWLSATPRALPFSLISREDFAMSGKVGSRTHSPNGEYSQNNQNDLEDYQIK